MYLRVPLKHPYYVSVTNVVNFDFSALYGITYHRCVGFSSASLSRLSVDFPGHVRVADTQNKLKLVYLGEMYDWRSVQNIDWLATPQLLLSMLRQRPPLKCAVGFSPSEAAQSSLVVGCQLSLKLSKLCTR